VKQDGGCQVLGVEGDPQMDALIAQIVSGLQQMANYIRSKSKVTGECTRQPNDPDPSSRIAGCQVVGVEDGGCQVVGVEGEPQVTCQVDAYIQQK
jgi:hypothetical protein